MSVTFSVVGLETQPCWACHGKRDDCEQCYGCGEVEYFSMNVANASAAIILRMLGKDSSNLYGSLDPNEIVGPLAMANPMDYVSNGHVLGNVITAGYNKQRIQRYIDKLCRFADEAIKREVSISYG